MGRHSPPGPLRIGMALLPWIFAAGFVETAAGADISRAVREGEERIEMRLRERHNPSSGPLAPTAPATGHDDAIEPWELVSV